MRIRGWSIDGFGHFRDYEVGEIGDGITVFHGPNEAGKSTLLAFLRGMLFGFPDRRNRESRYEPLRGGRHGGRLFLEVDGESWTLERDASARGGTGTRLFTPRGEGSDEDLRRALGSADARLFRSVFAFSLTELQSFETLGDEGARSRIFSAGIVGAGRAARQVIGELAERADALYKPRGRTQAIPVLLKQLAERRQATAAARRAARAYPELLREEEACLAEKQRLDAAATDARSEARHFEELVGLWPSWNDLQEAESQYAALEAIDAFPPNAEHRLVDAMSRLEAARRRAADVRAEYEEAEARVAAGRDEVHAELAEVAAEVAAHYETRDLYRSHATRLQAARVEVTHATDAVDEAVRSLGEGWDEDQLAAFDASLPQRDRIRAWADRLRRAGDDVQSAERDDRAAERALQQAEREVAGLEEQLRAAPKPDLERLNGMEAALRRLRARLADRRDLEHAAAQRRIIHDERAHALRLLESQAEPEPDAPAGPGAEVDARREVADQPEGVLGGGARPDRGPAPGPDRVPEGAATASIGTWLVPLAVAAFGLVIAGALARSEPGLGAAVAVLAVAAGVGLAVWLRHMRVAAAAAAQRAAAAERQATTERLALAERAVAAERAAAAERDAAAARIAAARRQAHAARLEAAGAAVAEARDAAERAQRQVDLATAAIAPEAVALGLPEHPTVADLDEIDRALVHQRQDAARAEHLRRGVAEAEAHRADLRDQGDAAVRRVGEARAALEAARREWAAWTSAMSIPDGMSPESALDFVPAVQQARERQRAREKLRAVVDDLDAEVRAWEERAEQLLARAGMSRPTVGGGAGALIEALHTLHARCMADSAARARLAAAETALPTSRRKLEAARSELSGCEDAWEALLAEAGAGDEAHFRNRMQTFAERERLRREIERLRRHLTGQIGDGPDAEAIRATLATGAVAAWARERERHEGEVTALAQQLEQAIRSHQDAQRRREALEISADIPRCEAEEQALVTELNDAVGQWRTLALARALTEVTLHEYVRTRQPAVVAHASEMFAAVTDGAYAALRQDESGEGLSVVTRRGAVLGPERLSRGTAEQLYLCLRLGLAAEFGSHGAQLPLVMDDVCVNFDPERARAIASVLRDFAAGQQVIFFTCHPTTVEMLRAVAPGIRVHEMPRHGAPAPVPVLTVPTEPVPA